LYNPGWCPGPGGHIGCGFPLSCRHREDQVGEPDANRAVPLRRRVGYVCGQWRIAYVSDEDNDVRHGLIVGPLVADVSTALWVEVVPDGSKRRTMIHRDSITNITPPRHGR
jgi:hypothetical protein